MIRTCAICGQPTARPIIRCADNKPYCPDCLSASGPAPAAGPAPGPASQPPQAVGGALEAALHRALRVTAEDGRKRRSQALRLLAASPRLRLFLDHLAEATGEECLRSRRIEALPEYQAARREPPAALAPGEQKLEDQVAIFLEALLRQLPPRETPRSPH